MLLKVSEKEKKGQIPQVEYIRPPVGNSRIFPEKFLRIS